MAGAGEQLPPTARSIALLLASTPAIQDSHPAVLHQLLEFSHRYTSQVLSDALVYAEHAGRAGKLDMEDVSLAVQARVGWEFGGRVPKEVSSNRACLYLYLTYNLCIFSVPTLISGSNQCHTTPSCSRSLWSPSSTCKGSSLCD